MTAYGRKEDATLHQRIPDDLEYEYRQVWRAKSGAAIECRDYGWWQVIDANGICYEFEDDHDAAWGKFLHQCSPQ